MNFGDPDGCRNFKVQVNSKNIIMKTAILTVLMLVVSNIFMTFAWYGNLRLTQAGLLKNWPLIAIILMSWGLAFLEYTFMVPANRMGFNGNGGPFSLFELKIIQECISLTVFTVIAMLVFQGQHLHWNHVCAFLCIMAAVAFAFLPVKD